MGRVAGVTATETRERLLRAAADAFARQGYDGTRVADIAASAGVSNGALYAHFGSKAGLVGAGPPSRAPPPRGVGWRRGGGAAGAGAAAAPRASPRGGGPGRPPAGMRTS